MERIVISLGGSLIAPKDIDIGFLGNFKKAISRHAQQGRKFAIVCGGGSTARQYVAAASRLDHASDEEKDWIGIHCTRLNAVLLKTAFGRLAPGDIVTDPTKRLDSKVPVIIAAGWKPGWSTDYVAAILAKQLGAKEVINMTNTDHVYTADPKRDRQAKPLARIAWKEYTRMFGSSWTPSMNVPFDPIASRLAQRLGLKVFIIGKGIDNLSSVVMGKKFRGTTIG